MNEPIERRLLELMDYQQKRLLACGRQIIPTLIPDDLLQPNDFPELENHPVFRYEEGVLAGIQTVYTSLLAGRRENE